nr:torsin-1A-interacting protein 2-like [Misgurnus anguillicaudatus]
MAKRGETVTQKTDAGESDQEEDGMTEKNEDTSSETEQQGNSIQFKMSNQSKVSYIQKDNKHTKRKKEWILLLCGLVLLLVAVAFQFFLASTVQKEIVVKLFIEKLNKTESSFPNQRPELWTQSRRLISHHLKTASPTEPVSLILTSGHGAEKTLGCLAKHLAEAFSNAFNSSVLNIDGKSKASQDSDQVKQDINNNLINAFDGEKLAAVIHRFEELPPGSTLIFYRYCDHENAAYKNVLLVFTVMLDREAEIPSSTSLAKVEDMVHDQIKRKFISSDKSAEFNKMDVDKLSGLWSRISHLILPVVAEEETEQQGCGLESELF